MSNAYVESNLYPRPEPAGTDIYIVIELYSTGLLTMIGLIPEKRRIGARIIKIRPKAKQNP
jgi:hypothetical protein